MPSRTAPYGSWRSPISADLIASAVLGLGQSVLDGDMVYWVETRPSEGGRNVIVRHAPDGTLTDVTPQSFNPRTRAHEYGGGDFTVHRGTIYFSNFADQQLYRHDAGHAPEPLTATPGRRYADAVVDVRRGRLLCVCEDHSVAGCEPRNMLVAVPLGGSAPQVVLAAGNDFYAAPRLSPDGARLAWLTWNHPHMPWDASELWVGALDASGHLTGQRRVAGGAGESIFQPEWSPEGTLYCVSDRNGWWNLYCCAADGLEPLHEMAADFGRPQWQFGMSTYAFAGPGRLVCSYLAHGVWRLALLDIGGQRWTPIPSDYTEIADVRAADGYAIMRASSPTEPTALVRLHVDSGRVEVLRRSSSAAIDADYLSTPEAIEFPTVNGRTAYGFFYRPRNRDYATEVSERPPLLVRCHGGPTAAAPSGLDLRIQYWTTRGIAVLDVNYGGSSGYGRAYRQRLNGQWGVVDVDDCGHGALHLARQGEVDGNRLIITGSSAGGFTALCALTFRDMFKAGASYYGISDLEALAADTHKFESRYEQQLIGPYPLRRDVYRQRSPIHHADRLSCPIIFFQGLDDKVVPPSQTESMVAALRLKRLPVAYLSFPGEQHGFRRAETIKRALESELYFYSRIFAFPLADAVEPVPIENLASG